MDKYHSTNNDQYLLTHNLIGAETFQELKDLEAMAFAARAAEFVKSKHVLTSFTEEDFKGLHQHLFQDVYSFAGEYRDVDLAKGDTQFCKAAFLSSYAKTLFNQLLHEPEWPSLAIAVERLAYFKAELNMLHPFREGNGRVIRMFIHDYAKARQIDWHYETITREVYITAMIQSVTNTSALQSLFLQTSNYKK